MKSMIILAAVACFAQASYYPGLPAPIQLSSDGKYVLDTPEVAHAKAAHLAAHAQASTSHGAWAPGPYIGGGGEHYGAPGAGLHKYGPAPLAHDGRVIDTPEVAHLKAAHIQALAAASQGALAHHAPAPIHAPVAHGYAAPLAYAASHGQPRWNGPPAHIQLTHDGQYVVDTPEVQHARAAHLAQYAHAAAAAASAPEEPWQQAHHGGWH